MTNNTLFFGQYHRCFKLLPKFCATQLRGNPETTSDHVGEFLISVIDVGAATIPIEAEAIMYVCENAVGPQYREIKAVQAVQPLPGAVATWRVEWYDSRVQPMGISGLVFQVSLLHPVLLYGADVLPGLLLDYHAIHPRCRESSYVYSLSRTRARSTQIHS